MPEVTALAKHACPACGAQAEWNPGKQALLCTYCGTESPYEIDDETGSIQEIDLVTTLRELPEKFRGWKAEKHSVRCRSCHAVSVFDPEQVGRNCEFCGSPEIVDYKEIKEPISPQSVLPFKIGQARVRENLKRWYASKWFAPGDLRKRGLVDRLRGVYLPYWTFDAKVHCPWTAMSGYYYYTTQSYRDSSGRMQTRQVRRVRWQPSSGRVDYFFDDEPVSASRGVDRNLLKKIEPWPTKELKPYDTAYLSGFVVEHYQVVLLDALREARESMNVKLRHLCAQQVPGDTHRNLQISPVFSEETFKHILAPVWLLTYDYGRRTFQVLVNGCSGKIAGAYPKSVWKIVFAVLMIVLAGLLILWVAR